LLQVDEAFQTSVENVYAVGDVINRIQLTPVGACLKRLVSWLISASCEEVA
jgi:pyruvate/2-oxoglutarate dehydrogenase complex dihydrolipoamide dehydrogenase (E3) component